MEETPPLFGDWRAALPPPWFHAESVYSNPLKSKAVRCQTYQRIGRRAGNLSFCPYFIGFREEIKLSGLISLIGSSNFKFSCGNHINFSKEMMRKKYVP
jgi:hypothetical protein